MARIFLLLILIIFAAAYYDGSSEFFERGSVAALVSIALLSVIILLSKSEPVAKLKGQYLKHGTLVVFGYLIVHFQYPIDYILGNVTNNLPYIWVDTTIVIKSLALSVIGLISFILGYLLYSDNKKLRSSSSLRSTGVHLLLGLSGLLLVGYYYFVNPLYLAGMYGIEDMGSEAAYFALLFKASMFATLIQSARNLKNSGVTFSSFIHYAKANNIFVNILILAYLVSVMFSGDRGPILEFALVYYGNYIFVTKRKPNIFKVGALIFIGSLFLMILGNVRNLDRDLSFSERFSSSIKSDVTENATSILPQTQELAGSIRALHFALSYVPTQHDYMYGRFQLQQIFSILPFGNSISSSIFSDNSFKYGGSSRFITWIDQGDNPYSGNGTTVTADFYFDFGILGVVIGMLIFGYSMRYAELAMYTTTMPTLFAHAFFIVFLSSAIYVSRSTYLMELKSILWTFVLLTINKRLTK